MAGSKTVLNEPVPGLETFPNTMIMYDCSDSTNYFDFKTGPGLTENIGDIIIECIEGKWNTFSLGHSSNQLNGSVCTDHETEEINNNLQCPTITIPDCKDRTIKCSTPPVSIKGGEIQSLDSYQATGKSH